MYINFNKLSLDSKSILNKTSLIVIQAIHQQKSEDNSDFLEKEVSKSYIEKFIESGHVKLIKGTSKDNWYQKLRTTKKGSSLLINIQDSGDPEEEDIMLYEWIKSIYSKRPNYIKGNGAEAKRRIKWFRLETGIVKNELSMLVKCFISDTFVEEQGVGTPFMEQFKEYKVNNPRAVLSNKIENIFWTPKDRYSKYYNLEDSPLWTYYNDNNEHIKEMYNRWKNSK